MGDRTWKALERRICRRFGQERNLEQTRGDTTYDLLVAGLPANVKHRKQIPGWLTEALDSEPVVIWHGRYMADDDSVITMRLTTLEQILDR